MMMMKMMMIMLLLFNRVIRRPSLRLFASSLFPLYSLFTAYSSSLLLFLTPIPLLLLLLFQLIRLTKTSTSPALNSPSFNALSTRSACFWASKDLRIFSTSRMDSLRVFWE